MCGKFANYQIRSENRCVLMLKNFLGLHLAHFAHLLCDFSYGTLSQNDQPEKLDWPQLLMGWMDGWMNGVLGHFYALSRLNWAGDNLG